MKVVAHNGSPRETVLEPDLEVEKRPWTSGRGAVHHVWERGSASRGYCSGSADISGETRAVEQLVGDLSSSRGLRSVSLC